MNTTVIWLLIMAAFGGIALDGLLPDQNPMDRLEMMIGLAAIGYVIWLRRDLWVRK